MLRRSRSEPSRKISPGFDNHSLRSTAGSWSYASGAPIANAVLTLSNYFPDGSPATLSLLDSGFFEVNGSGLPSHQYGHFTLAAGSGSVPGNPSTIQTQPAPQTVEPGAAAMFSVSVANVPGLVYQWRKDGISISGATAATFSIAAVQAADQGTYSVVVANPDGVVLSSGGALAIFPHAPVITVPPVAVSAFNGGTARFSVTATGFPAPTYQWKFYGTNVSGGTSPTLVISPVSGSSEGNYTCTIANSAGSVTTDPVYLTIIPQPGSLDYSFPQSESMPVTGSVNALLLQADGKLLVGGGFNNVGSTIRTGFYRVNADGSPDTSFVVGLPNNTGLTRVVQAPAGKFYITGSFLTVASVSRIYIARLNADGTLDTTFTSPFSTNPGEYYINDLAIQSDGKVVIVGSFTKVGGISRDKFARLNTDGTLDPAFNATGSTINDTVSAVATAPDGKIYIGGKFITVGSFSRNRIAAFTSGHSNDTGRRCHRNPIADLCVTLPLTYQWWKNGVPLENYIAPSFVLGDVTVADTGDYYVVVSNMGFSRSFQDAPDLESKESRWCRRAQGRGGPDAHEAG